MYVDVSNFHLLFLSSFPFSVSVFLYFSVIIAIKKVKNMLRNQDPQWREKIAEIPSAWNFYGEGPLILWPQHVG